MLHIYPWYFIITPVDGSLNKWYCQTMISILSTCPAIKVSEIGISNEWWKFSVEKTIFSFLFRDKRNNAHQPYWPLKFSRAVNEYHDSSPSVKFVPLKCHCIVDDFSTFPLFHEGDNINFWGANNQSLGESKTLCKRFALVQNDLRELRGKKQVFLKIQPQTYRYSIFKIRGIFFWSPRMKHVYVTISKTRNSGKL